MQRKLKGSDILSGCQICFYYVVKYLHMEDVLGNVASSSRYYCKQC